MTKRQIRKTIYLALSGGVLLQLAGCVSLLLNNLAQQVIGTVVGGLLVQLLRGAGITDGTGTTM